MTTRLNDYVEKLALIYPDQFGFRVGHSTEMALINIHDLISEAIDANKYAIGIFLDVSKGFDTVNHKILVKNWNTMVYVVRPLTGFLTTLVIGCNKCVAMVSLLLLWKSNVVSPRAPIGGLYFFVA